MAAQVGREQWSTPTDAVDTGDTGDFEGMDMGCSQDDIASRASVPAIEGRMFANSVECATRCARKLIDCRRTTKTSPPTDVEGFFTDFERLVDAYIQRSTSNDPYGVGGMRNPPLPIVKSRRETRIKDCTEGGPSNKRRKSAGADTDAL